MSKNLPTVTSSIPRDLRNFVDRLRDIVNGNGSSRLVSAQDLVSAGIANLTQSGVLSAAVPEGVTYGTPPAPTNVAASAAINNVIVTWDDPDYPGHAYAEVWGASTDNIGTAVCLGLTPGAVYTDPLGPGATRYYWVRFVNVQDLVGPYNAVAGTPATTGEDVDYLLNTLAGQITENELYTDLNTRIDGIEANADAITALTSTVYLTNLGKPLPQWNLGNHSIVTISDGKVGRTALRIIGSAGSYPNQGYYVAIDPTKKYRARFWARPVSTTTGVLYFSLRQFLNDTGTAGPVNNGRSPYKPSGQSRAAHNATYGTDQWGEYNYVWDSADWQTGVKYVMPEFLDNYSGGAGYWEIQDFTFTEVTATETLSASLVSEASVRSTADGTINAKYTVKIDNGGHISGYGLISTGNTDSPYASFGVRANQFFIAPPATVQSSAPTTGLYKGYVWVDSSVNPNVTKYYTGTGWSTTPQALPFVVQASDTTVDGVAVPAGVYMDAAFIKNATITNAKIANAAIDDAKISDLAASKITAGSLSAGSYIKSDNYQTGVQGFKINATGAAEFATATIRGTVYATNSEFTGTVKAGTTILGGSATNFSTGTGFFAGVVGETYKWRVGDPTGNRIEWDGTDAKIYPSLTVTTANVQDAMVSGAITLALDAYNYIKIDGPNQRIDVYGGDSGTGAKLRVRLGKL